MKKLTILTLLTLSAFISAKPAAFVQNEGTSAADTIREKVQEKVQAAKNIPFFYVGTVTDIAERTIQIDKALFTKSDVETNQIQQISIDEDKTIFVKSINKTSKNISFSDVAIGDFLIAMGYKNGNGVLEAKRVLVTSPIEPTQRKAVFGQVTKIEKGQVNLKANDGSEWLLKFGQQWKGPEIEELDEGTFLIAVGTAKDSTLAIRTIEIIPEETPLPTQGE